MERTVNNHQVTLQERHPRPEKLVASVVEARHITNGRDVSREDARGSQNIRALGGVRRSKVPSRARTSITADIEKFPDPSKSKRDVAAGSPPISPTHIAFTHLPSSTHSSHVYATTNGQEYNKEEDPQGQHDSWSFRNCVNSLYQSNNKEGPDTAAQPAPDREGTIPPVLD